MPTTIKTISDTTLFVNNKEVIKDIDGDWISKEELTTAETQALRLHLKAIENP
jgi:hypothetical protein